ncbi:MAG: chromate transporter [Tyzzerella sp.]|nr:chromate transporter [Tyzzerella sp.]
MLYLQLFYEFFKTGLFTIGGGMATVPFLYKMSDATGWFTYNDLANMIAVGESTPGPIGVNMATYVGFVTGIEQGGLPFAILGAVVATLGLITPSIIVILIIAAFLKSFKDNQYVGFAFYGLRPASAGLIAAAGISVIQSALIFPEYFKDGFNPDGINWIGCALAIVLWLLTNKINKTKKLHPVIFIAFSAIIGIVFSMG